MSDPALTPTDLGTYLGLSQIDSNRAQLVLNQATALAQSVVNPLPTGANAVILDVAAKAYMNPGNLQGETAAPFGATYGPNAGGLTLTRAQTRTLRRLNGGGGAFTIDTAPPTAPALPWWDQSQVDVLDGTGSPLGI